MTFVKCQSHRARDRLTQALGRKLQGYFSMRRDFIYGIYLIDDCDISVARAVKGVSVVRNPKQYNFLQCWPSSLPRGTVQ